MLISALFLRAELGPLLLPTCSTIRLSIYPTSLRFHSFTYLPFLYSSIRPLLHLPFIHLPSSLSSFCSSTYPTFNPSTFTFFVSLFLFLLSSLYFLHLIHPSSIPSSSIKHPFVFYHPFTHSSFPPSLHFLFHFHLSFNQLFIQPPGMSGPASAAVDKVTITRSLPWREHVHPEQRLLLRTTPPYPDPTVCLLGPPRYPSSHPGTVFLACVWNLP